VAHSSSKRLQVAATVSLGEKRFVAVIQVDGLQFLVGGGATNVALLAQLKDNESFGNLLKETMTAPEKQTAVKQMGEQA
jgi:flagellar biogenesis protein FliO